MIAALLLACSPTPRTPSELAAALDSGYTCGPLGAYSAYYLVVSEDFRARARGSTGLLEEDLAPGSVVEAALGDDATLTLDEGTCLNAPGCTDLVTLPCGRFRIEHEWEAVSGLVTWRVTEAGVSAEVTDATFTDSRGDAPATVQVDALSLPEVAPWSPE